MVTCLIASLQIFYLLFQVHDHKTNFSRTNRQRWICWDFMGKVSLELSCLFLFYQESRNSQLERISCLWYCMVNLFFLCCAKIPFQLLEQWCFCKKSKFMAGYLMVCDNTCSHFWIPKKKIRKYKNIYQKNIYIRKKTKK
jgi:hypothetical protein